MRDILEEHQGGQCSWSRDSDREAMGEGEGIGSSGTYLPL